MRANSIVGFIVSFVLHSAIVIVFFGSAKTYNDTSKQDTRLPLAVFKGGQSVPNLAQKVKELGKEPPKDPVKNKKKEIVAEEKEIIKPKRSMIKKSEIKVIPKTAEKNAVKDIKKSQAKQTSDERVSEKARGNDAKSTPEFDREFELFSESSSGSVLPKNEIFQKMQEAIRKRLVYPRMALKNGIEGVSVIEFELSESGNLKSFKIKASSNNKTLDAAALEALQKAVGDFPKVDKPYRISMDIEFKIER